MAPTTTQTQKLKGTIKTIKREEGYGFVTHTSTGIDYFFHRTSLERTTKRWETLNVDDAVEFIPIDGPKGLRAIDVRAL